MGLPYEDWPVREFILCLDDQEWELLRLRQQLLARFGERCIVESLQSPTALLHRLDELEQRGEQVALLLIGGQILHEGGWRRSSNSISGCRRRASCYSWRLRRMSW